MATIEQLEHIVEDLERKVNVALEKTNQLQRASEKVLDTAMHAYKLDEYGYLWAYEAETQTYRKTKMRVATPEIINESIKAKHIAEGAITGDKVEAGAVVPGKIADDAVSTRNIQNKAVTLAKLASDVLSFFSTDEEVREIVNDCEKTLNSRINNTINELSRLLHEYVNDLQNQINSLEIAGLALSNQFGEDKNIGMSQWAITQWARSLQRKIDELTGENSHGMYMSVSRDYVVGETGTVNLTAQCVDISGAFDHVAFYANNQLVAEANNTTLLTHELEITETTVITCVAKIMGETFTDSKTISYFSKAFYIGGGESYQDVMNLEHIVLISGGTHRGSYDIHCNQGDHIIIILDNALHEEFVRADMDGFEIPFTSSDITVDGDSYHLLTSENIYAAGDYNIDITVISPAQQNTETPNDNNNE